MEVLAVQGSAPPPAKERPVKSEERNYIFVINDEVSYEGFKGWWIEPDRQRDNANGSYYQWQNDLPLAQP